MNENYKSGFVALIGRPNVGKSTLINYFLGQKVSIISSKPQTTRNKIQGIYTTENEQIIFIDTPGIHKPHHQLGEFMNRQSLDTFREVDLILYIVDAIEDFGTGDEFVIEQLKKVSTPIFFIVNKIDLAKNKGRLIANVNKFSDAFKFQEIFYISALTGENIGELINGIIARLEPGPMYYPKDVVSDHPEHFIIAEIIREKVLLLTHEEVPHSVAVNIDEMKQNEENTALLDIRATIYVERQSQKKIIIGSGGSLIKKVGTLARKEIVMLVGQKVFLELWVKVEEDWRNKKTQLRRMGYYLENN